MDTIIYLLKGAFKILLLMIGAAMLFGGGICVVADAFFLFSSQAGSVAIWLGASALVALIGWGLIALAQSIRPSSSDKPDNSEQIKKPEEK